MQKITYNLYRVSTKKQLYASPDNKDDIPMQRQACREFAERMGWIVGKEFEEKGISGSKVSAMKRDAIQDLKDAALKNAALKGGEFVELPAGNYLFAQKRESLDRESVINMAVEIQQEGLWQRLKPGRRLYLRRLFEDGSEVTQLFRSFS